MQNDTITAISTARGDGAISIIRLSGPEAISIADSIFDKDLKNAKGYSLHYGNIIDQGEFVDEVLVSIFKGPKSYTGEDMVEINCHGGRFITNKVLSLTLGHGARLAERGEYTKRAYLNGRMDLAQAEGVNDLIHATDALNAKSAISSLKGSVKRILEPLLEDLTQIIAQIEVNIDYPEYDDVEVLTQTEILPKAKSWLEKMNTLIETAQDAVLIRTGLKTVILGKPNVGKSSLLNALLEEEKAIVTNIEGTTRDLVEGSVRLQNVTLHLVDTAGIRESDDVIEQIGIAKSLQALNEADLVILVFDLERGLDQEDYELLEKTKDMPRILVYNKMDVCGKEKESLQDGVYISAKNQDIQPLIDKIEQMYESQLLNAKMDTLNNERQIGLAISARQHMLDVIQTLEDGMELDLATTDLQACFYDLREITGEVSKEDLLDEIFSRFCLGK